MTMDTPKATEDGESKRLNIVGVGLNPWNDASIGAVRSIQECAAVFCAPFHTEFANAFKAENATVHVIREHLDPDRPRSTSYQLVAERICAAAASGRVAWITSGDPTVNCGITRTLLARCSALGIPVALTSGVTALTAVNALIPPDDRTDSFAQVNAKDLFLVDVVVDVRLCLFVIQVFQHVSPRAMASVQLHPRFLQPLKERLLRFYAPQHMCHLVMAATPHSTGSCQKLVLDDLTSESTIVTPEVTLVLPPATYGHLAYSDSLDLMWACDDATKGLSLLDSLSVAGRRVNITRTDG
jgi:uncharacterized protein YabN with tetrapyrrole methylase and pyrophosphatase domain